MAEVFCPSRLTMARERRGLTQKALANDSGVWPSQISKYEAGAEDPPYQSVVKLAFRLRFPVEWFYGPALDSIDPETISFRARSRMTLTVKMQASRAAEFAAGSVSRTIRTRYSLPAVDIPAMGGEDPAKAAANLRAHWRLAQLPIKNMVWLLERKGVEVYWTNVDSPCVDAFALWRDGNPYVFLNTHKDCGERSRFDAAHELAHLVLHRHLSSYNDRQTESEADAFASAFLLPEDEFRADCPSQPLLFEFLGIKSKWGVSMQAMIRRGYDIGKLSHWQYQTAFKCLSAKNWRTKEPGSLPLESSSIHPQIFGAMKSKAIYAEDFAAQHHVSIGDLAEIMPTAAAYTRRSSPAIQAPPAPSERRLGHLRLVE